ncbi:21 kDa protein-like [Silene latifolia]|uniref:21 kDa protein-like n=1 Tax=Silene latifolia TaxID=37657 RepID=UPI003D7831DB
MAFSFSRYFLCFLQMLFLTSHMNPTRATRPNPSPTFIKSECKVTPFPDLCYHSLSTYGTDIQASPELLADSALSVTITTTRSALDTVSKMSKTPGMLTKEVDAIRDCLEVLGDAVEELQKSNTEMGRIKNGKKFGMMMNDIQTWVSAALTNEDTCMQGFEEKGVFGEMKATVRGKIVNICHLTSNALALINNYASLHS